MQDTLAWLDKQLGRLVGLFAFVGSVGIFLLMATIVVAVVSRYGLNDPVFGIEDFSVLVLAVVAAAATIFGARNNAHISIDLISKLFGRKVTRITDMIMRILALAMLALAAYALATKACGFEKACITGNLSIEHRPFYYVLSLAMGLYGLHIFLQLINGLVHWNSDDPNDPGAE